MSDERVLSVDLTGSRYGPDYFSVEITGDWPDDWTDDELRCQCAEHYAIPTEQVAVVALPEDAQPCWECDRLVCACDLRRDTA